MTAVRPAAEREAIDWKSGCATPSQTLTTCAPSLHGMPPCLTPWPGPRCSAVSGAWAVAVRPMPPPLRRRCAAPCRTGAAPCAPVFSWVRSPSRAWADGAPSIRSAWTRTGAEASVNAAKACSRTAPHCASTPPPASTWLAVMLRRTYTCARGSCWRARAGR